MQRQAVLHWNRRLECLNRISQKALERKSWVLFSCSNFRRKCRATGEVELCYPSCGMTDFNSFGAEYRGATFVGVERQSLHQVKGRSPAQFIVVAPISTGYYMFTGTAIRVTVLRAVPKRGSLILQKLSVPITMSIIQILWMHRMRGMSRQGIRRETERLMMY